MYDKTISLSNRIITAEDLLEIFYKMKEELDYYSKIAEQEEKKNQIYTYSEQIWTLKNFKGTLTFDVNFYDNTKIKFDNYEQFITIFNNRITEIKMINVYFGMNYHVLNQGKYESTKFHRIYLYINEDKIDITAELEHDDNKMKELYNFMTDKIISAPEKYDGIIKNKTKIITKIGMSKGLILSIIIMTLLNLIEPVRALYLNSYILYPLATILIGYLIGITFFTININNLYESLIQDKKYSHYDSNKHKSVYVDDIQKYTDKSEILIGKNTENLIKRNKIKKELEKYKNYIPIELMIIAMISFIIIICKLIFE